MKKVEFHVHTCASKDSLLTKRFIMMMCKIKKINCLAITDHNEIYYAERNKEYFAKKGIEIIVGEEIFSSDGEIIGLYLKRKIEPGLSAQKTVDEIKKQNGLVYIPHPYDTKRRDTVIKLEALKQIKDKIDFMEFHNGRNISDEFSKKQKEICNMFNVTKIIGSDAHTFYELGRNYYIINVCEKENLKKEIENGEFYENKCLKIAHFNTKLVKLTKLMIRSDINEIIKIIHRKFAGRK